jgi:cold shock protein
VPGIACLRPAASAVEAAAVEHLEAALGLQEGRTATTGDHMVTMNGIVKRLIVDKGFGFVQAQDGTEYFFHRSACADGRFDELREGQPLTFEKGQGPKGPRAENVRVV